MRRGQIDNTGRTVRNLFTNPGAEGVGAASVVRTNLATNPTPTATAQQGWGTNGWGAGGVGTYTFVSGAGRLGGYAGVQSWSTIATSGGASNFFGRTANNDIPVTAGTVYSFGLWLLTNQTTTNAAITVTFMDVNGTTLGTINQSPNFTATAGTWLNLSLTNLTAPANAVRAQVAGRITSLAGLANGLTLTVDEILAEAATSLMGGYFDGSTAAAGDFTYAWTGAANASTSTQKALPSSSVSMQNCFVVSSTDWAANGSKSFRVIPGPTPTTDTSCNLPIALQNKTYTLMATCRVKTPQTGTPDALRARRIQLYYTGVGPSQSAQVPNVPGVYPLSVTFTVTDSTQYNSLRLYNGASAGNGDIWWDNVMLVEGAYTGDFINPGITPFSKWDGTANASTSVGYSPQLSDFAGKPFYDGSNVAMQTNLVVPNGPLTIYSVQSLGATSNNPGYWELSDSSTWTSTTGVVRLIGSLATAGRLDVMTSPTGSTNTNTSALDPMNLQVTAVAMDPVNSGVDMQMNGATTVSVAANASFRAASGATLRVGTRDGGSISTVVTPRILIFQGKHNLTTRQAISRYLGNKYSVNVA